MAIIRVCDVLLGSNDTRFAPLTWPGFYPIAHLDSDHNFYCAECADKCSESIQESRVYEDVSPNYVIFCSECMKVIISADEEDSVMTPVVVLDCTRGNEDMALVYAMLERAKTNLESIDVKISWKYKGSHPEEGKLRIRWFPEHEISEHDSFDLVMSNGDGTIEANAIVSDDISEEDFYFFFGMLWGIYMRLCQERDFSRRNWHHYQYQR